MVEALEIVGHHRTFTTVSTRSSIHQSISRCLLLAGWDGVRALVAEIHMEVTIAGETWISMGWHGLYVGHGL